MSDRESEFMQCTADALRSAVEAKTKVKRREVRSRPLIWTLCDGMANVLIYLQIVGILPDYMSGPSRPTRALTSVYHLT
jgi:hypothetical protein